ncbi:MAG TPA: GAF domain-containing sensor histidine kinase [Bacteriovoracaceae bacterium]|nr:GAF domain-containing sensor histidine kinase [Bacteriovoracaceae bacterium]
MIQDCSILLKNLDRLEALGRTGLFGTAPEEAFTRLNRMATKILKAPISIFSLIGENSQFFKSAAGFEITTQNNEVPIDISVCQYSLQGTPLSIEDTKNHPLFSDNPAVKALNIVGYLGIPVITKSGHPIGAVCVIDHKKRKWTEEEISILEEITASFLSEIELRQAMKLAKKESQLREEFIAIASHELKNPLSALKLQAEVVHKKMGMGRFSLEDNDKFLKDLQRQARRLELMIDDMSDSTRLATGMLTLHLDKVNLNGLIQNVITNLSESFEKAQCRVSYQFNTEINGNWDPSRLEQVITNIASNAIKYAAGSLVEINLSQRDGNAVLTIKDNGPGISAENQNIIFSKFGRASDTNHIHGLGLGLYISRQIIEQHKGSLNLTSHLGKGSTFTIILPLE